MQVSPVRVGMIAEPMTMLSNGFGVVGIAFNLFANEKECGFGVVSCKDIEQFGRMG